MKTLGYIRVSTNNQDLENQRYEILNFAQKNGLAVDSFISVEISSRKTLEQRKITEVLGQLEVGDQLVVSELSRLGRSTHEVLGIVNTLIKQKVNLICIKQNLNISENNDIQAKMMVTMFSLFAELERDLVSQRTRIALASKKANGVILGRRKGSLGRSKLDSKKDYIVDLLSKKVSISSISKIMDCNRGTVMNFMKSRKLKIPRVREVIVP